MARVKTKKKDTANKRPEKLTGRERKAAVKATKTARTKVVADVKSKTSKNILTGEIQHKFHAEVRKANPRERFVTFPMVGIGASAGGIEALCDFFGALSSDSGMAFVVIQHLDPNHASSLPEVVGRCTNMPVKAADHLMELEPNHIYIIPPNRSLGVVNGILRLFPRLEVGGQHMSIDFFFRCLADDQKSNAIGIVLSGGDSDGSLGLKEIKSLGGITFAQDPKTAKVPSMPQASIAAGGVDRVLSPANIAKELEKIRESPFLALEPSAGEVLPGSEKDTDDLFRYLRAKTGVDFMQYKQPTLLRRLKRRLILQKQSSIGNYRNFLDANPDELQGLFNDFLINVTSFFRDPDVFDALKKKTFPEIVKNRGQHMPIRMWIPGCSTGEEAYSIAMTMIEVLSDLRIPTQLQIFATDLSEAAIERARNGLYVEDIRADVSPERLRRFFVKTPGGYQISREIRDLCVFTQHDVTREPPFSRIDFISCRNLLIYLGPTLQKKVMQIFAYSIQPNGYLLLGPSETPGANFDLFSLVDKKFKIYLRKPGIARSQVEFLGRSFSVPMPARDTRTPIEITNQKLPYSSLSAEINRVIIKRCQPACAVVDDTFRIVQFIGKTDRYLSHSEGEANLNVIHMARNGLQIDLGALLRKAQKTKQTAIKRDVGFRERNKLILIDVEAIPIIVQKNETYFMIFFEESAKVAAKKDKKESKRYVTLSESQTVRRLREELTATSEYLQSSLHDLENANEELQSANEEILSSNEELQSTNEELETTKEELQSTNEELTTMNEELTHRNSQLNNSFDDLRNLLASVNIPIVMVGQDLRIRKFTPLSEQLLNLIGSDTGRPITDIKPNFDLPDLPKIIIDTIDRMVTKQFEIRTHDGRWYLLRIRPSKTHDNKIDGAVLVFIDIDSLKKGEISQYPEDET